MDTCLHIETHIGIATSLAACAAGTGWGEFFISETAEIRNRIGKTTEKLDAEGRVIEPRELFVVGPAPFRCDFRQRMFENIGDLHSTRWATWKAFLSKQMVVKAMREREKNTIQLLNSEQLAAMKACHKWNCKGLSLLLWQLLCP